MFLTEEILAHFYDQTRTTIRSSAKSSRPGGGVVRIGDVNFKPANEIRGRPNTDIPPSDILGDGSRVWRF